jgi:hypothetical protein
LTFIKTQRSSPSPSCALQLSTVIFLHDAERVVEAQIMERVFGGAAADVERLGAIPGPAGTLAGFRLRGAGGARRVPHCAYADAVQRAAEAGPGPAAITQAQMLWVAAHVNAQAHARGAPADVLVFGVGAESATWREANCGGRTVFVEQSQQWLDKIKGGAPGLEAYLVTYRGRVDQADAFYEAPWLMEMPQAVRSTCFDVVLIDGPKGETLDAPGRLEAAHFAVQHAIECMAAGKKASVVLRARPIPAPLTRASFLPRSRTL